MDLNREGDPSTATADLSSSKRFVDAKPLGELTAQVFEGCGSPAEDAQIIANHLVMASLMGYDSHGIIRIPLYVGWAHEGLARPGAPISVVKETEAIAVVDCGWNFGQVGAARATELGERYVKHRFYSGAGDARLSGVVEFC